MEVTGKLIVVTAPSGAGKTTIVKHLLATFDELAFSVSATSRAQRYYEEEGRDYYFMSPEQFKQRIAENAFLEWEEVYEDQYYGTLVSELQRLWAADKHIIFDIDVKGALNIQRAYRDRVLSIFIKPPSPETLLSRLKMRKTESLESLRKRISKAREELQYEDRFDRVLVNDDLDTSLQEAERIVREFLQL